MDSRSSQSLWDSLVQHYQESTSLDVSWYLRISPQKTYSHVIRSSWTRGTSDLSVRNPHGYRKLSLWCKHGCGQLWLVWPSRSLHYTCERDHSHQWQLDLCFSSRSLARIWVLSSRWPKHWKRSWDLCTPCSGLKMCANKNSKYNLRALSLHSHWDREPAW